MFLTLVTALEWQRSSYIRLILYICYSDVLECLENDKLEKVLHQKLDLSRHSHVSKLIVSLRQMTESEHDMSRPEIGGNSGFP